MMQAPHIPHGHGVPPGYPPHSPAESAPLSADRPPGEPGSYHGHGQPPPPHSQPYGMYHPPPQPPQHGGGGAPPPPSQYYHPPPPPPGDGKGGQPWSSGGHAPPHPGGQGDEYGVNGHGNDHHQHPGDPHGQHQLGEPYEHHGDKSAPGNHSGDNDEYGGGMPYPPSAPHYPHPSMPGSGYSLGHHAPYPTPPQPQYYPPPQSFGHPPPGCPPPPTETWSAPHNPYYPPYDVNNGYHFPPPYQQPYYGSAPYPPSSSSAGGEPVPVPGRGDAVGPREPKRPRLFSSSRDHHPGRRVSPHEPPSRNRASRPPPAPSPAAPALHPAGKSVRRKKKMYSDFVGVTYNKTHAKYQACITHYRKQHYLGRYRLAVDAALAYDESARLLKGTSWKVNFANRAAYEEAKRRELETIGKAGAAAVDVAGGLAAVAMKVEEIASNVGAARGGAPRDAAAGSAPRSRTLLPLPGAKPPGTVPSGSVPPGSVPPGSVPPGIAPPPYNGYHYPEPHHVPGRLMPGPPPPDGAAVHRAVSTEKVTPSPTFPTTPHAERDGPPSPPAAADGGAGSAETPLPASPNPTRHAMGADKGTPDSVIRPTVLSYPGGGADPKRPAVSGDAAREGGPSPVRSDPTEKGSVAVGAAKGGEGGAEERKQDDPTPQSPEKKVPKAPATPKAAPVVIQNGTLAAASALMTLFGNEKSPQQDS